MSKPLNEFGGWLNFCRFCVILSFIFAIVNLVLIFIALALLPCTYFTNINRENICVLIGIFFSVTLVLIQAQILKTLKIRVSVTPTKISNLFIVWLVLIIASFGVFLVMDHYNMLPKSFESDKFNISTLAGSIIPLSWLAYFRWSKRVKAYYGANAFE